MQLYHNGGIIDTQKTPFNKDKELIACCKCCEAYNGKEHDFKECSKCPTLALYKKWARLHYDKWLDKCSCGYDSNPNGVAWS